MLKHDLVAPQENMNSRNRSRAELESMGFAHIGRDVQIDREATFLNPQQISIGNRCRIDMGVLLSAGDDGIVIEDNVHIAINCLLFGGGGRITLRAFSGLSSNVVCYTASDDYTGDYLFGPTVPDRFRNVDRGEVFLDRYVLVGSGALLLPHSRLNTGAVVCAQTLISKEVESGAIVVGRPARRIGSRNVGRLAELAREYLLSIGEAESAAQHVIQP